MHANSSQVTSAVLAWQNSWVFAKHTQQEKLLDVGVLHVIDTVFRVIEAVVGRKMEVEDSAKVYTSSKM